MKVMLADDEESLRVALRIIIEHAGYDVCCASDGDEALALFEREEPDLVILDVMMPKRDGFEVCEAIRRKSSGTPVLMLSAKGDIVDKKTGFHAGADDYVTKPFSDEELLLRIEALLRRGKGTGGSDGREPLRPLCFGDLKIDPYRYEASLKGHVVDLTPKEYQILALMMEHPGKVFTREDLIECIWGEEYESCSISIPVYVRRIREKIEDDPSNPVYVQTVWRFGYRLGD